MSARSGRFIHLKALMTGAQSWSVEKMHAFPAPAPFAPSPSP